MSSVKRAREDEDCADAAGGGGGGAGAAAPFATLTQDDVLLVLGVIAQSLIRRLRAVDTELEAARAASDAWSARGPRLGDEGFQARARRLAKLAAKHAQRAAHKVPRLLRTFSARSTGLCRDTWMLVPPGLGAADAARVRAQQNPIWRAMIDLKHGWQSANRLHWAVRKAKLERVREVCVLAADIDLDHAEVHASPAKPRQHRARLARPRRRRRGR